MVKGSREQGAGSREQGVGRWGDGEMGRWGDGEMGRTGGVAELRNECAIIWCMLKPPWVPQLCGATQGRFTRPRRRAPEGTLNVLFPPELGG
ncbi:hypothetical protein [Moorena producens]|uniref:hypothetical protein n=1 Tax=Moorena producens TaxID=1155739 RepID=UPI003C74FD40